ncbi:MAG: carbohydrate ABC transporter permease [Clostridiaceae bacterium]
MIKCRKGVGDITFDVLNYGFMLFIAFVTLYPFYYILIGSLSSIGSVVSGKFLLWPEGFNIGAYSVVFKNPMIPGAYKNTIFITIAGTIISMTLTVLGAYVLSKKYLPGRNYLTLFVIITMMFNGGLIPTYLTVKAVGFGNTLWVLIIPGCISAYNMIVMRNFFMTIPSSMEESANIDGASQIQILISIILPLALPVIATISLFYAVSYWNSYFNAIIYLTNSDYWPLQVVLREVLIQGKTEYFMFEDELNVPTENVKMALVIVTILPILCVYPFLQRYFVKGLMVGSLKG